MKRVRAHIALGTLAALAVLSILSCTEQAPKEMSLKEAFEGKFHIGTALNVPQILGRDSAAIKVVKEHFGARSEEHTSELQSRPHLVCRLLLEKKKKHKSRANNKK